MMLVLEEKWTSLLVSDEHRTIPRELWDSLEGSEWVPDGWEDSNGCTGSPDYENHAALWAACLIHDWEYGRASGTRDRISADFRLFRNMMRVMEHRGIGRFRRAMIALLYWRGVRRFGWIRWKAG